MKAIVLDTETTGRKKNDEDPTVVRIVEAAYLHIDEGFSILSEFSQRYNPLMPISVGAMATHNIVDSDLIDCPTYDTFKLPADVEYIIGHNIDFDWKAIGSPTVNANGAQIKRICTLAMSRKLLPDVDSHTQSALMYYFFGEAAREMAQGAHGALTDVRNCLNVLKSLTPYREFENLWILSEECRIPDVISFGKHEGTRIDNLPRDYTSWLLKQEWLDPYLRTAVLAARAK